VKINGQQKILLDTATREGMSGSPVYLRSEGGYTNINGDLAVIPGTFTKFIGIYSGRIDNSDVKAQIGIMWHGDVIKQTLNNLQPASYKLIT